MPRKPSFAYISREVSDEELKKTWAYRQDVPPGITEEVLRMILQYTSAPLLLVLDGFNPALLGASGAHIEQANNTVHDDDESDPDESESDESDDLGKEDDGTIYERNPEKKDGRKRKRREKDGPKHKKRPAKTQKEKGKKKNPCIVWRGPFKTSTRNTSPTTKIMENKGLCPVLRHEDRDIYVRRVLYHMFVAPLEDKKRITQCRVRVNCIHPDHINIGEDGNTRSLRGNRRLRDLHVIEVSEIKRMIGLGTPLEDVASKYRLARGVRHLSAEVMKEIKDGAPWAVKVSNCMTLDALIASTMVMNGWDKMAPEKCPFTYLNGANMTSTELPPGAKPWKRPLAQRMPADLLLYTTEKMNRGTRYQDEWWAMEDVLEDAEEAGENMFEAFDKFFATLPKRS